MSRFASLALYILFYTIAVLPLRLLYCISDASYFFVYHVARYRRRLVRQNLTNSFPGRPLKEIIALEKEFYHHFCDTFFETVKMLNFSESRLKRHFIFKNCELAEYFLNEGRPVIMVSGHYGNWELGLSVALWLRPDPKRVVCHIYRPLRSKTFDELFVRIREKFHSVGYVKNHFFRDIVKLNREGKNWIMSILSDQKPSGKSVHHNMQFLNQDTSVITGTAKIARHTNAVVCYVEITKTKRSYYEGKIKLITDTPSELSEQEITERYMQYLEKNILKSPAYYLWSHNRWMIKI
jgi:KDO2-lipid IV(A) lauroyltransferase